MNIAVAVFFVSLCALSAYVVVHPRIDDTLGQRAALAMLGVGFWFAASSSYHGFEVSNPVLGLLVTGACLLVVSTLLRGVGAEPSGPVRH